ncbi:42803_t:CDS:2, partial [Gigaspora margarita]
PLIDQRKVSEFVNQAVEKELEKEQKKEKEELRQKLIAGYQANTKNRELQKELEIYDEATGDVGIPMTTKDVKNVRLVEVFIENTPATGIDYPSKLQFNYPRTIDKELRLIEKLGIANKKIMEQAKKAWNIAFN